MKLREALPALTGKMDAAVQAGIDSLNEMNDASGAAMAG
jgi:hypothetical protein